MSDRRFSVRLVPGRSRGTWERDEIRGQDPAAGALAMLLQRRRRLHWRTLLAGLKPRDVWKAVELLERDEKGNETSEPNRSPGLSVGEVVREPGAHRPSPASSPQGHPPCGPGLRGPAARRGWMPRSVGLGSRRGTWMRRRSREQPAPPPRGAQTRWPWSQATNARATKVACVPPPSQCVPLCAALWCSLPLLSSPKCVSWAERSCWLSQVGALSGKGGTTIPALPGRNRHLNAGQRRTHACSGRSA